MSPARHVPLLALAAAVALALLLAGAGLVLAVPPDADFGFQPEVPEPNETVTFSATASNPDGGYIDSIEWDFGDGQVSVGDETSVNHVYGTPGTRTVTMLVTDSDGEQTLVDKDVRVNAPPQAAFEFAPEVPNVARTVRFDASGSLDDAPIPPDGYDWDLNGDNHFPDAEGPVVEFIFRSPGDKTVGLRVTDRDGTSTTVTRRVHVNHPPAADFVPSPRAPVAAEAIDFTSISTDPEGPIAAEAWDLDGDGQFDDGGGKTVSRSFADPGHHTVALRVTDAHGARGVRSIPVEVRARTAQPEAGPERLNPFVRIATLSAGRRARRVTRLAVRVRPGATVTVRCRGHSCPFRRVQRRSRGRILRMRKLERRLRVGTRISIAVTYPARVGTYTSIVMRRRRHVRRDLCLLPGTKRPRSCASS